MRVDVERHGVAEGMEWVHWHGPGGHRPPSNSGQGWRAPAAPGPTSTHKGATGVVGTSARSLVTEAGGHVKPSKTTSTDPTNRI
mmetsp:Transcript_93627/g.162126  ORF Transcript_93627/g.162126 Transcript_93627/m.162126 type:complete len:84 (+) Transcript_93627:1331-1582(+)